MSAISGNEAGWASRLGYVSGLTSDDPADRAIALAHLTTARERVNEARAHCNEAWNQSRTLGIERWHLQPEYRRRHDAYTNAQQYAYPDALGNRPTGPLADWPGLPYALQYLEWETRFPHEWTLHAKKWRTKENLIRDLARGHHHGLVRTRLTQLVLAAVSRAYRCKDRKYVHLTRALDGDDLRTGLTTAASSDNPWVRLHAGYVLHLLDHPELPNSRRVWQTWCENDNTKSS